MKKKLPLFAIILIFLIGIGVLSYPLFASVVNNVATRQEANETQKRIKILPEAEKTELYAQARAYNASLTDNVILTDPFDEEAYNKIGADYANAFDVDGKGLIGYVDIPSLDVYLPIYHGTSEETLARAAGHLEMTSIPIGGESTHAVISAHSAFPGKTFFDYLTDMQEGDEFYIHVLDKTLKYEVDQISVVLPEETKLLRITKGEDHVTLVTCTPYSINSHRLLVRGTRVEYDDAEYVDIIPPVLRPQDNSLYFMGVRVPYWVVGIGIGTVVTAAVVIPIMIIRRRNRRRRAE
ncbi:MAG: class C sortase [Ruminococcus sp.]|nr:class C sortase [Ruminococcus sp.]